MGESGRGNGRDRVATVRGSIVDAEFRATFSAIRELIRSGGVLDSLQNRHLRARPPEITQRLEEVVAGYEATD